MQVEVTDIEVMVEGEGLADVEIIRIPQGRTAREIVAAVALKGGFPAEEAVLLIEDSDQPVDLAIVLTEDTTGGKVHHVHRAKQVALTVFYKHLEKEKHFPPSARVQRVLDWAVSKDGFNIDPTIAPDMELALHDEKIPDDQKQPLPKNPHIGRYVHHPHHCLALDLIRGKVPNGADLEPR
jgi:hypothetical protein